MTFSFNIDIAAGHAWFRFWRGHGLVVKDLRRNRLSFSERQPGVHKSLRLGRLYVRYLPPWRD